MSRHVPTEITLAALFQRVGQPPDVTGKNHPSSVIASNAICFYQGGAIFLEDLVNAIDRAGRFRPFSTKETEHQHVGTRLAIKREPGGISSSRCWHP